MHLFRVGIRKGVISGGAFQHKANEPIEAAIAAYKAKELDNIPFCNPEDKLYIAVTCFDDTLMGGWWFHIVDGVVVPYTKEKE